MTALRFDLHCAGVLAPGLSRLAQLLAVSRGGEPYAWEPLQLPTPAMLPAQERRRASQAVRLVLACIEQALAQCPFPPQTLRSVFATDEGTGEVCQQMLGALATTRQISPLLFANSVLNAPSGYFSIAWGNRQPANVVSLGLDSFASGLLTAVTEAATTRQPVLLVAYDPPMMPPLDEVLAVSEATASAWVVGCALESPRPALGTFTLALERAADQPPEALPDWMPLAWRRNSSARGLAALSLLGAAPGAACAMALGGQVLRVTRQSPASV